MTAARQRINADAVADLHVVDFLADSDDVAGIFMTQDGAVGCRPGRILGLVQVGAADAAAPDFDHHLIGPRRRIGQILDRQGLADFVEHRGFHCRLS